jgi:primosomal protein N''
MSMSTGDFGGAMPTMMNTERFSEFHEQLLDANREAARFCLDAYETTLESIAHFEEQAADQTHVEWIATAAKAHARFIRELAKRQVSVGRELLG